MKLTLDYRKLRNVSSKIIKRMKKLEDTLAARAPPKWEHPYPRQTKGNFKDSLLKREAQSHLFSYGQLISPIVNSPNPEKAKYHLDAYNYYQEQGAGVDKKKNLKKNERLVHAIWRQTVSNVDRKNYLKKHNKHDDNE